MLVFIVLTNRNPSNLNRNSVFKEDIGLLIESPKWWENQAWNLQPETRLHIVPQTWSREGTAVGGMSTTVCTLTDRRQQMVLLKLLPVLPCKTGLKKDE